MDTETKIALIQEGQIWRDLDPRFVRFVKILVQTSRGWVRIRSCDEKGDFIKGSRVSMVDEKRFAKAFDRP